MSGSDRPTRTADRPKAVVHLDPAQRAALGRAARAAVPRSAHAEWAAGTERADPVTLLRAQEATRVPELVPLRHERMLESPFTFYRGAAVIMAADLATVPSSGLRVQACGDAHLANFGGFAAPDRTLVFDMNDFDETVPGPFEWDVKRLAASFEIAARSRRVLVQDGARGRPTGCEFVPRGDGPVRDDDEPRRLVLPARRASRPRPLAEPCQPRRRQALRTHRRQGRAQGQPQGAVAAHAAGRWRLPDRERPADAGAGDRSRRRP